MKTVIDFSQGRMNRDTDDRFMPRGEYRLLQNGRVLDSDAQNVGVIEGLSGTELLCDEPLAGSGFRVIGMYGQDDRIYYFMNRDDMGTALVEYDTQTGARTYLLQDLTMDQRSRTDGYLNTICHLKGNGKSAGSVLPPPEEPGEEPGGNPGDDSLVKLRVEPPGAGTCWLRFFYDKDQKKTVYGVGDSLVVEAKAKPGYVFERFTANVDPSQSSFPTMGNPHGFIVKGSMEIVAHFKTES